MRNPDDIGKGPIGAIVVGVIVGLALFEAELDSAGPPAAGSLLRARHAVTEQQIERAMEEILESIAHDPNFAESLGRKAMLLCFSMLGEDSEVCGDYRRRLATLLY